MVKIYKNMLDSFAQERSLLVTGTFVRRMIMTQTIEQIATAISRHAFEDAYPHLLDDVQWNIIGGANLVGKAEIVAASNASAEYLSGVTTRFDKFAARKMDNTVVIESTATYTEQDGETSVVACCDIYDFVSGKLANITSYNIELPSDS